MSQTLEADAQGADLAAIKALGGNGMVPQPVAGTPEARSAAADAPPRKTRALDRVRSAIHRAAEALRR